MKKKGGKYTPNLRGSKILSTYTKRNPHLGFGISLVYSLFIIFHPLHEREGMLLYKLFEKMENEGVRVIGLNS